MIGLLAALGAGPAVAQSLRPMPRPERGPSGSVQQADALIAAAKLSGSVSYIVLDLQSGAVLEERLSGQSMPPASVTKAVTALYALEKLGAGFRFSTRVLATGAVQNGVVQGDLILAGGGDPTLQTDQLGDLARSLGIKGVTGGFYFYEGALPQMAQVADDQPEHVGYNPSISGLNLNFNRVHFEWKRAGGDWSLAMDARGERFNPAVRMTRMAVAAREAPLFTYKLGAGREDWTVASGALGKGGSRWLPVRQPGLYAAEVFQTLMVAQGVTLPAPKALQTLPRTQELGRIDSAPLPEVLRDLLRWSTNISAEVVGLMASGAPNLAASGAAMGAWLEARFGVRAHFADHSGLGSGTRISPLGMAQVLRLAQLQSLGLRDLLRDTPMQGPDGKALKSHPVKLRAKSGTLNFVTALAGYIAQPSGRDLVFVYMAADSARRDAIPVSQRENPDGSKAWISRARKLQGQLITRWSQLYG